MIGRMRLYINKGECKRKNVNVKNKCKIKNERKKKKKEIRRKLREK